MIEWISGRRYLFKLGSKTPHDEGYRSFIAERFAFKLLNGNRQYFSQASTISQN
ncbi:MAG: hypothetical protein ACI9IT_002133 [Glaciecola sp.]|jgi:hypothetical protein